MELFNDIEKTNKYIPLAERMRPKSLEEFAGQEHLIGKDKPIRLMIEKNEPVSMILWGPPGVGKTTLAILVAEQTNTNFIQLSSVSAGVKDVRNAIEKAKFLRNREGKKTILFIDEIHRFNKAQQDSLLHSVEKGIIILIGATTENPSFEVISPLLSRCRLYILEELRYKDFKKILKNTLEKDILFKNKNITIEDDKFLIRMCGGDARKLLNALEFAIKITKPKQKNTYIITNEIIKEVFQTRYIKYDKNLEEHYNIISAFIKSIRGSDPDAAVYWLGRMLKGGEDPKFIARRMIILASEDIGNADPYAITLAVSTFTAVDYIGMPEARIVLSQCATYLASCPKSNASYLAIENAMNDVEKNPDYEVPLHLRNAPTKLMGELGYGKEYKYAHDYEEHYIEQQYLPDELKDKVYYKPTDLGREEKIKQRLKSLNPKKKRD